MSEEKYLKLEEAAGRISISIHTLRKWIATRKIRYYKFGGAVRIKESDLYDFAVENEPVDTLVNRMLSP